MPKCDETAMHLLEIQGLASLRDRFGLGDELMPKLLSTQKRAEFLVARKRVARKPGAHGHLGSLSTHSAQLDTHPSLWNDGPPQAAFLRRKRNHPLPREHLDGATYCQEEPWEIF